MADKSVGRPCRAAVLAAAICMAAALPSVAAGGPVPESGADLVVYGKIFTSEGGKIAEAFAVKDGRYVFVGDRAGADAYVEEGWTEVVDRTGRGLVMPGCGNGHAHYIPTHAIQTVGTAMSPDTDLERFFDEVVPAAVKKARDAEGCGGVCGRDVQEAVCRQDGRGAIRMRFFPARRALTLDLDLRTRGVGCNG